MFRRTISRRRFLATAAMSVAATQLRAQNQAKTKVILDIPAEATGPQMPTDFVGLSYEVQQLVDPNFFSAKNTGLIRAFREISSHGVLRLGGNTSEFAWWKPSPESPEPEHPQTREVVGEPRASYYAVTAEAVRNLADFLKATGWTCLYGIGMGTNTPARAADEAAFVSETLGPSLQYFQIGNEADLFSNHLRDPKTWSAKAYLEEWLRLAHAIMAKVPEAQFGMPDVASNANWLTDIAAEWPSVENPPHVTTLTHHYYFGGPATNPAVNIPNLMAPATMAKVQKTADIATAAAKKMNARVRMTEGNTCYRGGKPGVSDVFAAALWSADYSLLLAANNYSGINLHGGTGKSVANSVGGSLPGDALLQQRGSTPEEIASHPHPFYTPIATFGSEYKLEPVARGLQFAGSLSGGRLFDGDFTAKLQQAGVNATAYAAELPGGKRSIIILNKDLDKDLGISLDFGKGKGGAVQLEVLESPSIESREARIASPPRAKFGSDDRVDVSLPHASGVRVTVG
jgi:hypothetical protein